MKVLVVKGTKYLVRSSVPLEIGVEARPSCISGNSVLIGEQVDQRVGISKILPNGHHNHTGNEEHEAKPVVGIWEFE